MSGMMPGVLPDDEIEVAPTKSLFVEMLTRDIGLNRAVIDLVDNSIDGARRMRPEPDEQFDGLEIMIKLDGNELSIQDNCGGIGIELARHYAFRIGRPKEMPKTPNSVGQFGVGMKRALFKFGRWFEVMSTTTDERFRLEVDVDRWEADAEHWRFRFDTVEKGLAIPPDATGTTITVKNLRDNVSSAFALETFRNGLGAEIQAAEQVYIDRGLRIVFDDARSCPSSWCMKRDHRRVGV